MPWSGVAPNQTYTRTDGTRTGTQVWQEADGAGVDIVAPDHDIHDQDLATAIGETLKRDGGNQPTADLPMGGFKHTGAGDASARDQYTTVRQHAADAGSYCSAGGTANAITLTTGFSLATVPVGARLSFKATSSNTGAVTVSVDGLAAVSVVRNSNGAALTQGEIRPGAFYTLRRDTLSYRLEVGTADSGSADVYARIVKAGTVMAWTTSTAPSGWLHCDGSAVSRTTYAELFAAIGTNYGVGDGSTTFNLPNYRGEFLRGWANGSTNDPDRASRTDRGDGTTGDNVGTKQAGAVGSHAHTATMSVSATGVTSTDGSHTHSFTGTNDSNQSVGSSGNSANRGTTTTATGASGSHSHTVSVSGSAGGTTDAAGGNETRPRNVAVMWIILASPALAAAGTLGLAGFSFAFDSSTIDADPGAGRLRFNSATYSSATAIYISETDGYSAPVGPALQSIPANSQIYMFKVGDPGTYALFTTTTTVTDAGSYDKLPSLTYVSHNGSFAAGDTLSVVPFRAGAVGPTGAQGADGGIRWTFDSSTTMDDPGSGDLRLNNATLGNVTEIALSANNAETGNPDISNWVATWDDSTTTANRGQIIIRKATATENYVVLNLTSAITDNTTWLTGTVSVVDSNGSFSAADPLLVSFHRTGDKGSDGTGSGTVTSITAGGGFSASGVGSSGGAITTSGTLTSVQPVNAQTGTTYTMVTGDNAKLVTFSNASSVAVTLPQATSTFGAGWHVDVLNKGAGTVTITPTTSTIDGAATLVLAQGEGGKIVSDGTNYQLARPKLKATAVTPGSYTNASITVDADGRLTAASSGASTSGAPSAPQGRITLTSATPVLTGTVSGATTVYYAPYVGRYVPLYTGSSFTMTDIGGELSQATTDSTKSPAACTTNTNYDLFVWNDSGTYRCTRGPAWSSSTSRGTGAGTTELEQVQGLWLNKVDITNGPAANRGTYVGTLRTNGSSQIDYILGGSAAGGTAAVIGVWNAYNRVAVSPFVNDSTFSWSYGSSTIRSLNNSVGNRISFVRGLDEDGVTATHQTYVTTLSTSDAAIYIGLDSTSARATNSTRAYVNTAAGTFNLLLDCIYAGIPGLGWHYLQALENAPSSASSTFYGGADGQGNGFCANLLA